MTTDTSEKGLESLICAAMTGADCDTAQGRTAGERRPSSYGVGWVCGDPRDYDRDYCVDLVQLAAFLDATQPNVAELLALGQDGPTRQKFLARLQGEIAKRGTVDVLRKGVKHGPHQVDLFYGTPSPGNEKAKCPLRTESLQRHAPASVQPRQRAAGAGSRPVHQRLTGRHLRTEEQPYQADRGRRGRAVQA